MNRSSKTVIKRVSNDLNFHNSQIAGPSTRNVPYVPPIDIADLSTQNEPDILELHSDSDDNIDDISVQVSQNNTQNMDSQHMYNGFKYPPFPQHLKNFPLDLVTERLISPRIPFMQIRRLRHVLGQFGIYGQVINVPIEVNTMVNSLPRNIDDDHSITVHIKRKKIHKSNYLCGIVNKRKIKAWLQHLKDSPLYTSYGITVDDSFFNGQDDIQDEIIYDEDGDNDISEQIPIDESLVAQQQTLMWNDEMYLTIAPGEGNVPVSLLFDEHAEELSFPQIYLGQFRTFRDGVNVTSFMMATSELRRSDRRGVTPQHLLYMAMKIMRIRIRDSLSIAFKHVGKGTTITKEQIKSEDYVQGCIETWLDNAPEDALGKDYNKAIDLIDSLISVSAAEASDEEYVNVIRAGINRPKVFPKRQPHEKWHNPFNPFIINIVQFNTDFQFITEEYSCAAYVVEYINKTNRGVSNLQRKIIEVMDEHPEFDIFEITRNISINLLNHTEITIQEAAWYLLREPMSKSSTIIVYIPTVWPIERQRIKKKTMKALSELDDDCTDIWKENWFDKYEKRPQELENVSLAQFVSKYYKNNKEEYVIRNEPKSDTLSQLRYGY
ncbi:helitron_like_N domain-containing protein [Trichonephila clavipes]|uniref:Helitron_like_N domain-containing protein n=1 Tax=Trichonephila clavipes TaxID=2585209 RepID=A0A8X6SFE2_TRICX|nr:helitron_like_N domain-containing protein [Trichonephila clavipes]